STFLVDADADASEAVPDGCTSCGKSLADSGETAPDGASSRPIDCTLRPDREQYVLFRRGPFSSEGEADADFRSWFLDNPWALPQNSWRLQGWTPAAVTHAVACVRWQMGRSPPPCGIFLKHTSQIEIGDLAESSEVHLGVAAGGIGVAMAQVVANLFQRQEANRRFSLE